MSRQIDFEVIKADLENAHKLDREQILELANELVTHVEKSHMLIMQEAQIFLETHVSIEARDMEIKRLKTELESSLYSKRMLRSVNDKLRDALEFYANEDNNLLVDGENTNVSIDGGKRARAALNNHSLSN